MDQLAQRLYEAINTRASWVESALAGPTPVGTKKVPAPPVTDESMPELDIVNRLLGIEAGLGPHIEMAAQKLGSHAAVLAPYFLQDMEAGEEDGLPEEA